MSEEESKEEEFEPQPEFDISKFEKWIGNSTPSQAVHLTSLLLQEE